MTTIGNTPRMQQNVDTQAQHFEVFFNCPPQPSKTFWKLYIFGEIINLNKSRRFMGNLSINVMNCQWSSKHPTCQWM